MTAPACSEAEFIALFEELGAAEAARRLGVTERNVNARRVSIERRIGRQITGPDRTGRATRYGIAHPHRLTLDIQNGTVLVGSDAHIWPGPMSTAMRAFVAMCKEMRPAAVVMNGDVMDCATISRHPPIGWEKRPTLQEEIEAAQDQLHEVAQAARKARKLWLLGNHDQRLETKIATVAPEFAKVHGVHLRDHFPLWEAGWSAWCNGSVVIKHRWKGGINAPRANTLNAGLTMVTGHLHRLNVSGLTDYHGTRYGVDCGTLANPTDKAFVDYTEDAPLDWASGFVVLTFHKGKLLQPELVRVFDADHVDFRGGLHRV